MKLRGIIMLSLFCLLLMNTQCDEGDDIVALPYCDGDLIVNNDFYEIAESANYTFGNIVVNGDCLSIDLAASGCNASTWVMNLVDSEAIAESNPPQRYLKLVLYNDEACLAVFNKEESFDLVPLRLEGLNQVILNIEGFEEPILYSY